MILILYGPDTYRSRQKLHEIITAYQGKAGSGMPVYRLDAEEDNFAAFRSAAEVSSLFSPKKLVVLESTFSGTWDPTGLQTTLERVRDSTDTVVVLWDRTVEGEAQKKILARVLPLAARVQKFDPLGPAALGRWIQEEAHRRGLKLYPRQLAYLTSLGNDLWGVVNEFEKWAVSGEAVTGEATTSYTIFELGDTFLTETRQARRVLLSLLSAGQDPMGLFSYLVNYCRKLLVVREFARRGTRIPASLGIHPFVAQKALAAMRLLPPGALERFLERFFEEDLRIKTGATTPREALLRLLET